MSRLSEPRQFLDDIGLSLVFFTRLRLPSSDFGGRGLADAIWAAPFAGLAVAVIGALVYAITSKLGLAAGPAAALTLAATMLATGCLHEDGLSDIADGFGGGRTRDRKLEIMRDSRIGTYGVCALLISFVLRIGVLASLGEPTLVAMVLIAAHAAARAPIAAFMRLVPPARPDGMSAQAGKPPRATAIAAGVLGIAVLVLCLGLAAGLTAALLVACGFAVMAWICRRQIGGQTGDVLGALEQAGEMVVLLVAAAAQGFH
jgi:adenosylcobinamide-GDP ribazoletransferase